jgi:hypothetical protein
LPYIAGTRSGIVYPEAAHNRENEKERNAQTLRIRHEMDWKEIIVGSGTG